MSPCDVHGPHQGQDCCSSLSSQTHHYGHVPSLSLLYLCIRRICWRAAEPLWCYVQTLKALFICVCVSTVNVTCISFTTIIFNLKLLLSAPSIFVTPTVFQLHQGAGRRKTCYFPLCSQPCRRWRRNTNSVSTIKLSQLTSRPMSPTCWLRTKSSKTDCLKFKYVLRKKGGGALHDSKQQGLAYSTAIKVKTSTNNTTSCWNRIQKKSIFTIWGCKSLHEVMVMFWQCWYRSLMEPSFIVYLKHCCILYALLYTETTFCYLQCKLTMNTPL